jgi:hypothetical protein
MGDAKVGIMSAADGTFVMPRASRTGGRVVTNTNGFYNESASRGNIFAVSTAVAGVAPGTALSTTPPMAIWNPVNSGKNLSVLKTTLGLVSGTLGGGSLVYAVVPVQPAAPTTGTELVPQSTLLGFPKGVGRAFQGSTVAATPAILRPAFVLGAFVNTAATPPAIAQDILDGEIVIPPGSALVIQGVAAAGTTPLVLIGVTWEEIPV